MAAAAAAAPPASAAELIAAVHTAFGEGAAALAAALAPHIASGALVISLDGAVRCGTTTYGDPRGELGGGAAASPGGFAGFVDPAAIAGAVPLPSLLPAAAGTSLQAVADATLSAVGLPPWLRAGAIDEAAATAAAAAAAVAARPVVGDGAGAGTGYSDAVGATTNMPALLEHERESEQVRALKREVAALKAERTALAIAVDATSMLAKGTAGALARVDAAIAATPDCVPLH